MVIERSAPGHDALAGDVLHVLGQRVGRNLPTVHTQTVVQVVQRPLLAGLGIQAPAQNGDLGGLLVHDEDARAS